MEIKALTTLDMLEKVIIDIENITKEFCDNYCKYGTIEDDVPICTHEGTCRLMDELGGFWRVSEEELKERVYRVANTINAVAGAIRGEGSLGTKYSEALIKGQELILKECFRETENKDE